MTKSNSFTKSKHILGAILGAALLFAALLFSVNVRAEPAPVPPATVWLQVPPQPVDNDSEIKVSIRISDVIDLYGIELVVDFDPDALQVIDQNTNDPGTQIEPADCPVTNLILSNAADNSTGSVSYAVTQFHPTPPVSGDCNVANIYFKTMKEMTTTLSFSQAILSDLNGTQIPAVTAGAELEIAAGEYYVYLPSIVNLVVK